ncbi:DUF882 domain-containing protein [Oculatella sp. FACHB-28]|uniref:D-Ala-D-Ala carboxypeptidase family metallohydrolase n=1 Tax=Oculatella sp. FACHB-28 TaxID=2692845 RepID=UPI0016839844|nr:D-Ala-D-Ala carboxypeptidase family metallohydrolase [Oculatella sp. FACHB-28]MBD2059386.1 DUF882 domain-containing protein [Oculatella sp. FACHB-28]
MADLTADQRNYYYLLEAARTGIHKPILAALYEVHDSPRLTDGETGLGISPANRIPLDQVNTFPEQVQYAANTVRSITNRLTAQAWRGDEIWDRDEGRYTDRFVETIAKGYAPPANDTAATRLESSDSKKLLKAYIEDLTVDYRADQLPHNLADLDPNLLTFTERLTRYYTSLPYQREALLEAVRLWRKLDNREAAIASFNLSNSSEANLDRALLQFIQQVSPNYSGYPHQREALLRLAQLWRQLDSREEAIATIQNHPTGETNLDIVDPALIAFAQRIPKFYQGKGEQRNALTEMFRLWRRLDSRASVLTTLGLNPQVLTSSTPDRTTLVNAASQLDRELLEFVKLVPTSYQETEEQREALIRLVQLWRGLDAREKTIQSLFEDLRRMEQARRDSQDAPPIPEPPPPPSRPSRWTPSNIRGHMYTSIIPNGNFTWAEATHGGTRMPPNQATVDAMVRIAQLAQQARDRIGRPFRITSWYRSPEVNRRVGGASESRHIVGDAIDFYCDGLSGNQLYWALDPWWPGGLGRYQQFPELSHIDARGYRARWKH